MQQDKNSLVKLIPGQLDQPHNQHKMLEIKMFAVSQTVFKLRQERTPLRPLNDSVY